MVDGRALRLGFLAPPDREDIQEVLYSTWRKLAPDVQDSCWDIYLIANFAPEEGWTGEVLTFYGTMTCTEKSLVDNTNGTHES